MILDGSRAPVAISGHILTRCFFRAPSPQPPQSHPWATTFKFTGRYRKSQTGMRQTCQQTQRSPTPCDFSRHNRCVASSARDRSRRFGMMRLRRPSQGRDGGPHTCPVKRNVEKYRPLNFWCDFIYLQDKHHLTQMSPFFSCECGFRMTDGP